MTKEELEENYLRLFERVYSYSHFLRRFRTLIDQLDPQEIRDQSPLTWAMRRRRQWDYLRATFYLCKRYLLSGSARDRRFLLTLIRIARRKGGAALHLVYETLVFFISQHAYVQTIRRRHNQSRHYSMPAVETPSEPVAQGNKKTGSQAAARLPV